MASKKTSRSSKKASSKPAGQPHRKAVVFVSLIGVLTLTTGLLVALSPDPLNAADRGPTLLNAERTSSKSVAPVADTRASYQRTSR